MHGKATSNDQAAPGGVRPAPWVRDAAPYAPPAPGAPISLKLDANEGPAPPPWVRDALAAIDPESLRRYPRPREFEAFLASRLRLDPSRVLVTAGGDDAIDRACRVALGPARALLLPVPTFEMFARYAAAVGAPVDTVPWPEGAFPATRVVASITERTGMAVVVSPNSPTGAAATADDLRRVSDAASGPGALVLADLAYAEFADEDLTDAALALPNVVVVRTLSKAWGLAGLRVGYALGPARIIAWLRAAGNPYAVSGPSLALARAVLERAQPEMRDAVARARRERAELCAILRSLGARASESQANFVLARLADAERLRAALAQRGIAVRGFPSDPLLADALRITVPCDDLDFARLRDALRSALSAGAPTGENP